MYNYVFCFEIKEQIYCYVWIVGMFSIFLLDKIITLSNSDNQYIVTPI